MSGWRRWQAGEPVRPGLRHHDALETRVGVSCAGQSSTCCGCSVSESERDLHGAVGSFEPVLSEQVSRWEASGMVQPAGWCSQRDGAASGMVVFCHLGNAASIPSGVRVVAKWRDEHGPDVEMR